MIPYFQILQFSIGPISIQSWGTMVALGFLTAILLSRWFLKKKGLNHEVVWDFGLAGIIGAIVFARIFHVIFYRPQYFFSHPLEIFHLWQPGYSLYGGMAGVIIAVYLVAKWKKINFWQYAEAVALSAPLGLAIGRIGCFLIHDHPGIETNFFLGVQYPDATRWDLGLMQAISGLLIFIIFLFLMRQPRFIGFYSGFFLIYYGLARFLLDFLRISQGPMADVRYFYFTPAQYFSVALAIAGIFIFIKLKNRNGAF